MEKIPLEKVLQLIGVREGGLAEGSELAVTGTLQCGRNNDNEIVSISLLVGQYSFNLDTTEIASRYPQEFTRKEALDFFWKRNGMRASTHQSRYSIVNSRI